MKPLLSTGDVVLVSKLIYLFQKPHVGDIVVLKNPQNDLNRPFVIKRINKKKDKRIFITGDNDKNSVDSRIYGWVDQKMIVGKMVRKLI